MVAQWYYLRLETQEIRVGGHVNTRSTSPRLRRSLMLTFATKKLSTGANGQKAEAEFPFCPPRDSFDRAVMVAEWYDLQLTTLATRVRTLPWARRES